VKHLSIHPGVSARDKPSKGEQQGPTGRETKGGEKEEEGEKRGGGRKERQQKDRTGLQKTTKPQGTNNEKRWKKLENTCCYVPMGVNKKEHG
jgi:hypothetical protein